MKIVCSLRPLLLSIVLPALLGNFSRISEGLPSEQKIFVRINQLGFHPRDVKSAVAFAREPLPHEFSVIDLATRRTVFNGSARTIAGRWGQFDYHAELNFSAWQKPGKYFVRFGESESPSFEISGTAYRELPDELLEFMRQQRCGYNPWLDAVCHSFDGRTAYGPLPAGTYLDARGGWHDAGDLLKYLLTSSNATAQLLLAYQLQQSPRQGSRPESFQDHFNSLGQPGANSIADVLDEARWGLEWMLKLHPAPGQLYHQVADDRDHKGWRLPQNVTVDYGWGPGSYRVVYFADGKPQGLREYKSESSGIANLAGRYAAAMALGYQIWKGDPELRGFAVR